MKLYKIKKSNIDNRGLYASRDIKEHTKVIEYKGRILTKKQVQVNPKFDNDKAIYLFNLNRKYDHVLLTSPRFFPSRVGTTDVQAGRALRRFQTRNFGTLK